MNKVVANQKLGNMDDYNPLPDEWEWFREDRFRIMRVMKEHGLECSEWAAFYMWSDKSDDYCAGWLCMPNNDEDLFSQLAGYYTVEEWPDS